MYTRARCASQRNTTERRTRRVKHDGVARSFYACAQVVHRFETQIRYKPRRSRRVKGPLPSPPLPDVPVRPPDLCVVCCYLLFSRNSCSFYHRRRSNRVLIVLHDFTRLCFGPFGSVNQTSSVRRNE